MPRELTLSMLEPTTFSIGDARKLVDYLKHETRERDFVGPLLSHLSLAVGRVEQLEAALSGAIAVLVENGAETLPTASQEIAAWRALLGHEPQDG